MCSENSIPLGSKPTSLFGFARGAHPKGLRAPRLRHHAVPGGDSYIYGKWAVRPSSHSTIIKRLLLPLAVASHCIARRKNESSSGSSVCLPSIGEVGRPAMVRSKPSRNRSPPPLAVLVKVYDGATDGEAENAGPMSPKTQPGTSAARNNDYTAYSN